MAWNAASVVVSGNPWKTQRQIPYKSWIDYSYTFPQVTGTNPNISYGGVVQAVCDTFHSAYPSNMNSWYTPTFVEGNPANPQLTPTTCFVAGGSPGCPNPLPNLYLNVPAYFVYQKIFSAMAQQSVSLTCPTSVTLSSTTPLSLAANFPQYKTGIGVLTAMRVNPPTRPGGATNWNGAEIQEYVTEIIDTCPSNVPVCFQSGNSLTVGEGGGTTFGVPVPPTDNIFWDEHAILSDTTSLLNAPGVTTTSCTLSCLQTYRCNGVAIGSFNIIYGLSRGTIQGTPVTNVIANKQ